MSVVFSEHLPLLASAPDGIQKLRGLIFELAVRGKLVPQDPDDEPASELLKRIAQERARLEAEGTCKKSKATPLVAEEEKPFALPKGWLWVRLADIASFENGDRSKNYPSRDEFVPHGIPFINAGHLFDRRVNFADMNYIPQARFDALRAGKTRKGDLLFCLRGSLGKFGVVADDGPAAIASSLVIIRLYQDKCLDYVEAYLSSPMISGQISRFDNGTAQPNLGASDLTKFVFPLPPLGEQHRIVAKVDELMALCDRLEAEQTDADAAHAKLVETLLGTLTQSTDAAELAANWQRLAEHFDTLFTTESSLDALKQTILQLAVMGKLVPQDPNDEPASELLKRIAKERARLEAEGTCKKMKATPLVGEDEQPFQVPQTWAWVRLSEVTTKITDGTHHSPPNLPSGDFKYISAKNIKPWGIDQSGMTFVTAAIHNEIFSRCNPEFGDVLYIKDGATTGVAAINTLPEPFSMLSSVALLKPSIGLYNRYLYFLMTSPVFYDEMRAGMTGVAITRVTLAKLNAALLPLPPLAEQHRIVAKVDELMALCDGLMADLAESRTRQARLSATLIESALQAA